MTNKGDFNNLKFPQHGTQSELANFTGVNLNILTQLAAPFLIEMNVHVTLCVSSLTLASRLTKPGFSRVLLFHEWIKGIGRYVCVAAKARHMY